MATQLSQAFAPLLEAFWGKDQSGLGAEQQTSAGARGSTHRLPQIEYPAPVFVKNTFLDTDLGRPIDLDGFYHEREIRSTPASTIEAAASLWEQEPDPYSLAKRLAGRSSEPDGSSSRRSTSVGSSSARSGSESPARQTKDSPRDAGEQGSASPTDRLSVGDSDAEGSAGFPELDYPAPLFVRNTFLHADIGRPVSLDGFFEERPVRSCPASAVYELLDTGRLQEDPAAVEDGSALGDPAAGSRECEACWGAFATPECTPRLPFCTQASLSAGLPTHLWCLPVDAPPQQAQPASLPAGNGWAWATPECTPELPSCERAPLPLGAWAPLPQLAAEMPPPPLQSPTLPVALTADVLREAPTAPPSAPTLLLSDAVGPPALGSPGMPTVGSADHGLGSCKPCAHAFSAKGCRTGVQCAFCHLCPPGELKRQQKAKRQALRRAEAAAA